MDKRQKFLRLREIFHEVIEAEVRKHLESDVECSDTTPDSPKSKIYFSNVRGDMFFCHDKYILQGDGTSNDVIRQIYGGNEIHGAPTFAIRTSQLGNHVFSLYLERPDIRRDDESYFIRDPHDLYIKDTAYRLDREEMLENDEFQKCILEMIGDIAPERLEEVRRLVA